MCFFVDSRVFLFFFEHIFFFCIEDDQEFLGSEPSSTLPPDSPVKVSARAERLLYLTGGLIFLIGTFYFQHPQMVSSRVPSEVMQDEDVLYAAIWMFIIGSIIFVLLVSNQSAPDTVPHHSKLPEFS